MPRSAAAPTLWRCGAWGRPQEKPRGETINTLIDPSPDPRSAGAFSDIEAHGDETPDDGATGAQTAERRVADEARLKHILELLENEKAEDIVSIDLRGKSSIADFMVIASGRSSRHVGAICEKMIDALKELGGPRPRPEGVENGDWALIDASDVVIHVFRPEVREFYALEKMWAPKTAPEESAPEESAPEASPDAAPAPDAADGSPKDGDA